MSRILSPIGRIRYSNVFDKNTFGTGNQYDLVLLFPKDATDMAPLKQLAKKAAEEQFGAGKVPKSIKSPIRDGAVKDHLAGFSDDVWFVRFWNQNKPIVVGPDLKQLDVGDPRWYPGAYAQVQFSAFAGKHKEGGPYVAFKLHMAQLVRDGDPIYEDDETGDPSAVFQAYDDDGPNFTDADTSSFLD